MNEAYGIKEKAIVDNKLFESDESLLHSKELDNLPKDWVVLLASDKKENYQEIRNAVYNDADRVVCDIAEVTEINKSNFSYQQMHIDECNEEQLQQIFERTKREWEKLGEEEPYWSVVTHEEFKRDNIDSEAIKRFYGAGWLAVTKIVAILTRNGIISAWDDLKQLSITEYGCGCGRVTKGLSKVFKSVMAVDISKGNIDIARKVLDAKKVETRLITDLEQYRELPETDIVYSYIVLQHNTPPVIEYLIGEMLNSLKAGGVAIFQVPTYKNDYRFEFEQYMKQQENMEMHLLPQKRIFEIAYEHHCIPIEVQPELCTGWDDNSVMITLKKMK